MYSCTLGRGWVGGQRLFVFSWYECLSVVFSLRELTCMHCVYLALWTRKVLCGVCSFIKMYAPHINFNSFNIFIYHRLAVVLGHWKSGLPRKFKYFCLLVLNQRSFQPLVCLGRADGVGLSGNFIVETRRHSHKVGYKFRCQHCTNLHYADFSRRCGVTFSPPVSKSCCLMITDNSVFK